MTREGPDGERSHPMITRRSALTATAGGLLFFFSVIPTPTTSLTPVPTPPGRAQWVFEPGDWIESSPTVVDGTVFVGSYDDNLYAVDAETGSQQWAFETDDGVGSSPTIVDGTVFVGSYDTNLYAVDAETGSQQWAFETDGGIYSSPTVVDGTVFVGSYDHNLYAVDAETGSQQWAFETDDGVGSSPTVVDGTVFIGSDDANLYAVDAETGSQQWAFETDDGVGSSPTVVDDTVFVGSDDTNLYAVDIETGSQQWAFETDAEIRSSPTVVDGTVFIGSDDDNLYAVDAETGSQEWAFKTDAEVRSSPTVAGGTVFVGSFDGDLHAVDIETGSQQWAFETDAEIRSSPTVVSGTVFVGSYDTNLYAVKCYVGSSDGGSRVSLGTLGHHDEWRYTDQSITIPAYAFYTSWVRTNIELLGVGGVATGGYGAWRWWSSRQATTPTSDETESTQAGNSEQAGSEGSGSIESEQSIIEGLREQADIALESAETAREHNDLSAARDDYEKALETYQAAVDELSVGQADTRTELEAAIESTCQALDEVMTLHEAHGAIVETLQPAERSLQEAIVAYIENDQTVARIRFRQARDTFEDAHETIVENEVDLLTDPVAVDVQPDREPASTTISDLPVIPEVAATELADVGIETIDDLDGRDESPWTPAAVEKLVGDGTIDEDVATALTLMSWWHGDVSYTFETAEEVERRQQQTDYGFNQSS